MSTSNSKYDQRGRGWMAYPTRHSFLWFFYKIPLLQYRLGFGKLLHRFFRMLVLTTRGRKSRRPRYTMLEHTRHNNRAYIAPGWGDRTLWHKNIVADPRVTVQDGRAVYGAIAVRVTEAAELADLYRVRAGKSLVWKEYLASWGVEDTLEDYLAKRDRLVVLRLDPSVDVLLPPLRTDLTWVWVVVAAAVATFAWAVLR
jgi:deazaflavin-dependent oxidoreductase (nitroreductase family)